ncbi:phosphonoacetate hydrolase [Exophiala aquamarina CBS 119918]|uniref:Phosphonoacetate hydrolase n=1 Tax=Exophiala aquamarina CBS 119918 TaxID=1182545 RepID=A0A072NY96_9EURO|nr:phosphonoacetate hydrolase [Exophiala aquamarina CBS 119918]KEF52829.1 phosphonoacetate hydrolase [Exophiala aquamarina CBS 119918]
METVQSLPDKSAYISVHGRKYSLPTRPTVAVCIDGFDPEYLSQGIADGIIPHLGRFVASGFAVTAKGAMPSFTNPNNLSIITGAPTSAHGVAGNFFLDKESKKEFMLLDDSMLRGTTILKEMASRGVRVAAVTAKDKLRRIIAHGLKPENGAISFSSEKVRDCTMAENGVCDVEEWIGRPAPSQYSGDLSLFVLDAGVKILEEDRADLLYLTLSDFIQHHHAPGSQESNEFMKALDARLGQLTSLGALVAVTGDHGMSDKADEDGKPNVLFLQDVLEDKWGRGVARIICPITDPFVKHHGALGSFVRVHLADNTKVGELLEFCKGLPHVELALDGKSAAETFEMPLDREADIVVIAKDNAVIGSRAAEHDLSSISGHRLRSHGGLSEQEIPLLLSGPVKDQTASKRTAWRNFDIFHLLLNEAA